jgi:hypothetical protein
MGANICFSTAHIAGSSSATSILGWEFESIGSTGDVVQADSSKPVSPRRWLSVGNPPPLYIDPREAKL